MRKIAYSILALIVMAAATLTASAQSESRPVSGFDKIASGGSFTVHVKINGTESLKIAARAEIASHIETKVEDGLLEIQWKDSWQEHHEDNWGRIDIYVTAKSLSAITNAGSGNTIVEGAVSGDMVNIVLSGSGSITTAVKATDLRVSTSGSGSIHINGNADMAKINTSGSGSIYGKQLHTNTLQASIAGSGNIYIIADKSINGSIAGSGSIIYSGSASEQDVSTAGSGRVRRD